MRVVLRAVLILQFAYAHQASAGIACEPLFDAQTLTELLPSELQSRFAALSPRIVKRFERRFDRRELVSAENEAARVVAELLLESSQASLKLRPLLSPTTSTRHRSIKALFEARLRQEDARVELENRLLEIGYGKGSPRSQAWSAFQQRHAMKLAIILKISKNAGSVMLLGAPFFLRSMSPMRNFRVSETRRVHWNETRSEFEQKVDSRDSKLIRELKIEAAIELASRIAAVAILALITDELLNFSPKWRSLKAKAWNAVTLSGMEDRSELERIAYENWKDVAEAFSGVRPADDSQESVEIRSKIKATSGEDLWIHVHEQGPLSDPPSRNGQPAELMPFEEEDQMYPMPNFER